MQTNPNIEDKRIVEIWEWHDGYSKSCATKKVFRKLRRKRQKRLLENDIRNAESVL